MASSEALVNFSGASSGIDWSQIIDAQIQARTAQIITPIQNWQSTWQKKASDFDQLNSLLSSLSAAVQAMDRPSDLQTNTADSSDSSVVGVSISGSVSPGNYSIAINQLAEAQVECHSGLDSADALVNNTGATQHFKYTYAGRTVTLDVASGTTLSGLRDLINNDGNNPGIVASLLSDGGSGFNSSHLVLRGENTGSANSIAIDAAGTTLSGDWSALASDALTGSSSLAVADATAFHRYEAVQVSDDDSPAEYHILDSVAGNTLNLRESLSADFTTAQNAFATPRGISSGLSAAAASGGSQITVADASHFQVGNSIIIADGSNSEQLTISAVNTTTNTLTLSGNLTNSYAADGYVTQLEGGRKFSFKGSDFTQIQAAQNAQFRVDGYPASGWLERSSNTVTDAVEGLTLTLKNVTDSSSPVRIAVTSDPSAVKTKVQAFVDAYNKVKTFLNEEQNYDPSTKTAGDLLGNYAAEMIENDLNNMITGTASGFLPGTDPYTMLAQIGVSTTVQGSDKTQYGTLTFDETTFDKAMADNPDGVVRLLSDNFSGFSDSGLLTFQQASSLLTTPGTYNVKVDFDASGNITAGWIKAEGDSEYRSAAINGSYIVGQSGKPEDNLWVKATWDGSSTSESATVRVTQGVAGVVASSLNKTLDGTDGLIKNVTDSYRQIVSQLQDRIDQEQARLTSLKDSLTQRYAKLEQLISQLQGMSSWATSLSNSMTALTSKA